MQVPFTKLEKSMPIGIGPNFISTVKIQVCHCTKHEVLEPCTSKDNQKDLSE